MANIAAKRIKREFKEVIKSEELGVFSKVVPKDGTSNQSSSLPSTKHKFGCAWYWVLEYCLQLWDGSDKFQLEALESIEKCARKLTNNDVLVQAKRKVLGITAYLLVYWYIIRSDDRYKLDSSSRK